MRVYFNYRMYLLISGFFFIILFNTSLIPQEHFVEASTYYKEKNYSAAYELYKLIPDKSSYVWYYMGNCLYKMEEYPKALVAFEQAEKYAGADIYLLIKHNQRKTRLRLGLKEETEKVFSLTLLLEKILRCCSLKVLQIMVILLLYLYTLMILVYKKRPLLYSMLLCLIIAFMLLIYKYHMEKRKIALVTAASIPLYTGPDSTYAQRGTLGIGNKVVIIDQKNSWYKVHSDNEAGWVFSPHGLSVLE